MIDQMDDGLNIISITNLAKIEALCLPSLATELSSILCKLIQLRNPTTTSKNRKNRHSWIACSSEVLQQ